MFSERKAEYKPIIKLTHHFKIWYGTRLNEKVVKPLEIQRKLNPTNDMVLFVNKEILGNIKNEEFLNRLRENNIQVVDILSVFNLRDLNEMKLKYAIERMINKGLDNLEKAKFLEGESAKKHEISAYRCFATSSDITRCLKSFMKYKCSKENYRVYSDTDYFLFKIPDQLFVTCLLGTSEEKFNDEFNRTIRNNNVGMDVNFIAIPPDHPWINEVRNNWVNAFALKDYYPSDYLFPLTYHLKSTLSLDDKSIVSEKSKALIDSYSNFPQPAVTAYFTLNTAIQLSPYSLEKILIDRQLDEMIFINMKQGSWYDKEEIIFTNNITVNESKDQIELIISKEAFKTDKKNPLMGKELLKFLILGKIIPDISLTGLENISCDYNIIIPLHKKSYFLEMITAFVCAYNLEPYLKGTLRTEILRLTHVSETKNEMPLGETKSEVPPKMKP